MATQDGVTTQQHTTQEDVMATVNRVILMGNLTRTPELRHTHSGTAVSDLGLAVNDTYRDKSGELVERTCFADIVVWGRQAEACCSYLHKGRPVVVEGRLQLDQWQTDTGEKRSRLRVCADRVIFLNGRKAEGDAAETEDGMAPAVTTGQIEHEEAEALPF